MKKIVFLLFAVFGIPAFQVVAVLPDGCVVVPEDGLVLENGVMVATKTVEITVPVPGDTSSILLVGRSGTTAIGLTAELAWSDGAAPTKFPFRAEGNQVAPDGNLRILSNKALSIRPNLNFYATPARKKALVDGWGEFPAASAHFFRMEVRSREDGGQVWLDDRFIKEISKQTGYVTEIKMKLGEGAAIQEISWGKAASSGRYLPLTVASFSRPEKWADVMGEMGWPNRMNDATVSLAPGAATVQGIPFQVAPSNKSIDVSGNGFLACPVDDLVSSWWRRSSLDALPEACIISVPLDTYAYAYVLCAAAVDDEKIPEFNLRLSRNANGRGDALADSPVRIPADGRESETAKKVGMVEYGPAGVRKKVPLWLIRVPLKNGLIQDVLRENEANYGYSTPLPTAQYLDIELMEPVRGADDDLPFPTDPEAVRQRVYTPPGKSTAMYVFGVTLESSPAELVVRANTPVYAFYAAEKPSLQAEVIAKETGKYTLSWSFADVDGKIATTGTREVQGTAGETQKIEIPVTVGNGWYSTQVKLRDASGNDLVDHRGTFVVLPPDTRKAGRESPYGTWWFNWAHGGTHDYARVGDLMQKAGLRHTMLLKDEEMAASQVSTWCIPWKQPGAASIQAWVDDLEAQIRKRLEGTPETTTVMIHHETDGYNARFPSEIWGEEPKPLSEKDEQAWENRMKHMLPGLKMVREKFPQLKMQFGNTGDSCGLVAEMLRRGIPKEYVDYIAVEDLGQSNMPEKPGVGGLQSAWFLRETARHFGYDKAQITACYEWINRMHMKLGFRNQAEWYVRDALHAQAYGFKTISMSAIHDAGQGYFHSLWGNGAYCFRYPYMYPKPSYAAIATNTRLLDSTKFQRLVPTGSLSLYAMEFERGGEWVYALWVPRGEREVKISFPSDEEVTITDLYGRERTAKGSELAMSVSTGVQYITSKSKVKSVESGKVVVSKESVPKNGQLVHSMTSDDTWTIQSAADKQVKGHNFPQRTEVQGQYETRIVKDAEMGECTELELKPEGKLWPMLYEITRIKPTSDSTHSGPFKHVGVWVKGNSSWGEVMAEIQGEGGKRTVIYGDTPSEHNINFDGWTFVRLTIPTGPEWNDSITILSFLITLPRQVLYGTEFTPVQDLKIRMKDVYLY